MNDPFGVPEGSNLSGGIDYPVIDLPAVDPSNINFDELNLGLSPEDLNAIFSNPNLLSDFANFDPESAALLKGLVDPLYTPFDSGESAESETRGTNTTGSDISKLTDAEKNKILTTPFGSVPATGVKGVLQQFGKAIEDLTGIKGLDAAKYAAIIAAMKMAYDDAERARKEAKGTPFKSSSGISAVTGPGGVTGFRRAAQGGVMSLAGGGEVDDNFLDINTPAGEATQYDIYGNMIMPDPYLRSMTEEETNQSERNAMREYYNNPENIAAENQIYQQLRDAVFVPGGQAGTIDAQETLRNIRQNAPEEFAEFINQLRVAPSEAKEFVDYRLNEAPLRTAEGFGNDNIPYNPDIVFPLADVANSPNINRLVGDLLNLSDPNTSRTFFEGYNPSNYNEGFIRGGGGAGGGLNRDLNYEMSAYATGGVAGLNQRQPFYLGGPTDGMADQVPAHIDNKRPAALSDGEFVIPADVVSHLGNGNSNAGAQRLYKMMDDIREARTGNREQGIQINPNKFMPR